MNRLLIIVSLVAAVCLVPIEKQSSAGETSVTFSIPGEVKSALDEVGVHIESGSDRKNAALLWGGMIGGGLVVAAVIIALAIKRKNA